MYVRRKLENDYSRKHAVCESETMQIQISIKKMHTAECILKIVAKICLISSAFFFNLALLYLTISPSVSFGKNPLYDFDLLLSSIIGTEYQFFIYK